VTSLAYIRGREDKLKVWALDKLGTNFVQTPTPRVWVTGFVFFLKRQSWWAKFRLFSFKYFIEFTSHSLLSHKISGTTWLLREPPDLLQTLPVAIHCHMYCQLPFIVTRTASGHSLSYVLPAAVHCHMSQNQPKRTMISREWMHVLKWHVVFVLYLKSLPNEVTDTLFSISLDCQAKEEKVVLPLVMLHTINAVSQGLDFFLVIIVSLPAGALQKKPSWQLGGISIPAALPSSWPI
jgi:hypothetical protein